MRELNMNDEVYVRLTDVGRAEYKRQWDEIRANHPKVGEYKPKPEDEEGWSKWQLHSLFSAFGGITGMGLPLAFETTIRVAND